MKIFKKLLGLFITFIICFNIKTYAEINVAFTIDNNYPIYTLLTINSILLNNKSDSDYTFWIIENDVTPKNKNFMTKYVEERNQKINFINVSMDNVDKGEHLFKNSMWASHVTRIGNARILLPEILPKNVDKVLYMDSDTLVLSDLKELYDTDIKNYAAGMTRNNSDVFDNKKEIRPYYFNSGVILMNTNYWRKMNATKKMISYLQNHELQLADQDTINAVLRWRIKKVDQKWNNQTAGLGRPLVPSDNGGIIHYIGGLKPWMAQPNHSPEVKLYYNYWNKSGLKRYQLTRFTILCKYYTRSSKEFINVIKRKYIELIKKNKPKTQQVAIIH